MSITDYVGFRYAVLIQETLLVSGGGTSVRFAPQATLVLKNAAGNPITIYSDENRTVLRTDGVVVTDSLGHWSAYVGPEVGDVVPWYKGTAYDAIPVGQSAKEGGADLEAFAAAKGLNAIGAGEVVATREWIAQNVASGLTSSQIAAIIDQRLAAFIPSGGTSTGGISASQVDAKITTALSTYVPNVPAPDLSPYARIRGDDTTKDIVVTDTIPTAVYEAVPQISANGKIYLQRASISQAPNTPVTTPEASTTITTLSATQDHFVKAYVANNTLTGTTIGIRNLSRAMEQSAIQGDFVTFDKLFTWAEANFKRTASSTAKDLYGTTYTVASTSITTATVDTGAMLTIFAALFKAWNVKADTRYKDAASKILSDLVNYCVIYDEGRAYLAMDETQKQVSANGQFGHHLVNGNPISAHEPGAINVNHFYSAKTFTGNAVFDQLIAGWFDIVNKMASRNLGAPFADFVSYNSTSHQVGNIANGTDGWTIDLSSNFGPSAQRIGSYLLTAKVAFNASGSTTGLARLRSFYSSKYGSDTKLVDTYLTTGAASGSTESSEVAITAALILEDTNKTDTVAVALRSNKIVTASPTDANGSYYPIQVKGATPSSSLDGDLRAWLALSRDQNQYQTITTLGPNPSVGVIYGPGNTTGGTTTPVVVTPGTTPGSSGNSGTVGTGGSSTAIGTYKLLANPLTEASRYYNANSGSWTATKKARWNYGTSRPSGKWVASGWDPDCNSMREYLQLCKDAGAAATVLSYDIPGRDVSGGYSAGGAATETAYRTWLTTKFVPVLNQFPTVPVFIDYEPDSAADLVNLSGNARKLRADLMKFGIQYIMTNAANVKGLYVDLGHPRWHNPDVAAGLFLEVGGQYATGFAVNTSNAWNLDLCVSWANSVRGIVGTNYHFTVDVGRSGSPDGGTSQWANPPNRRFGRFPQAGNLGIDGLDLICDWKCPGESDGNSGDGAPSAGQFWPTYFYNDSLGDNGVNVDNGQVSQSSGLCQRPPVPGIPVPGSSSGQVGS